MLRKTLPFLLLSALQLTACTDPAPGGPCKADLTCGDGLVCNFQAAKPICLADDDDEDKDGLKNAVDLCPATAGGTNHDEDGDKQGDLCDLCPIEPWSPTQKDADGDKVAGICDPLDTEKGESILFFEGFGSDASLTGWKLDDAAHFTIANDALKATVTAADTSATASYALSETPASVVSFVGYRVVDPAPAGIDGASRDITTSLFDTSLATNGGHAECGSSTAMGQASTLRLLTDKGDVLEPFPGSLVVGDPYRLVLHSDGGLAQCVQTRGQAGKAVENPVEGGGKGGVAVAIRSVAANFEYVLVVKSVVR